MFAHTVPAVNWGILYMPCLQAPKRLSVGYQIVQSENSKKCKTEIGRSIVVIVHAHRMQYRGSKYGKGLSTTSLVSKVAVGIVVRIGHYGLGDDYNR
ncbi:hypothetical protein HBI56_201410 [Parastagonospora nodorum]|nr:hypothetical protein HBH61_235050 [Parastagonospora nodorum]KAH4957182.1 hypothetical protein HBI78_192540 [Parastagonospora nodorum]KAH4978834.1 hypothetical protein HBI76_205050 [Parastagonospora nodorum]KAH5300354.1 hypothetical protein HBI12_195360 [Parastagonospora nodorum]KAH5358739.1 hypothetical protein HBI33_199540 [Parastagonospora nodorum]